jgi:hypothetical protein
MRTAFFLILAFSLVSTNSYCQLNKMFTKHVNRYIETDLYLNPISDERYTNTTFEIYFDKTNNYGYVKVNDIGNNKKWKMNLKKMYTGSAKGLTIYYFQSSDNKYKFSVSEEENGLAQASYESKTITVFYLTP